MPVIWILIVLALFIIAAAVYFFCLAFVRKDIKSIDDIDSPINDFLNDYRPALKEGIKSIEAMPKKEVFCKSFDGLTLAALYFDNGSSNTIILFHGYRSSAKRDFCCAVKMYADLGLNILLVDQRAQGKSEGKIITFGVKERYDVASWCDYAVNTLKVQKILLGGMSMGSTSVLLASQLDLPNNVKGIIADCGFTSPTAIIKKVAKQAFKINATPFLPIMDIICRVFGRFSIYGVSTSDALKNSNIPVIFIHGLKDSFVPCDMSIEAYEAAVCNKRLVLVENADHGLSFLIDTERVLKEIKDFVTKVLI